MGAVTRGVRNVYRSAPRAVMVVLLLGLTVAIFLTMVQATEGIRAQTNRLASAVQTLIEVRAAGASGMGVGQDALPQAVFAKAREVANIAKIEPYLYQRTIDRSQPTPISIVVGVRPGDTLRVASHGEVGDPRIVAGRSFEPSDDGRNVAVVGQLFARTYGLAVGSQFVLPAKRVLVQDRPNPNVKVDDLALTVIGIFDSGFAFGDNQIFVPLDVAQRTFAQDGKITHIFMTASSVDKVDQVERDLLQVFGDQADVISGQSVARTFAQSLGAIQTNTVWGSVIAIAVGMLVTVFTMALVANERTREIGTLKALGASNGDVMTQFAAEAAALAALGVLVGLAIYALGGSALAAALLQFTGTGQGAMTFIGGENPVSTLGLRFTVSPTALASAAAAIVLLSLLGGLYPILRATRIRPAEALRYEG